MGETPQQSDDGQESLETPAPPEDLPEYVTDPLKRQPINRLRAISKWTAELADHHENAEVEIEGTTHQSVVSRGYTSLDYAVVEKHQTCGDDSCACMSSEDIGDLHGPYIYKVEHVGAGEQDWTYYGRVNNRD